MIEVYKTNVRKKGQANELIKSLSKQMPLFKINFDLDDRDKILRVEGKKIKPEKIIQVLKTNGYHCEELP
jgi:uncharacterized protein YggU (UPF0235/DUF167 family)